MNLLETYGYYIYRSFISKKEAFQVAQDILELKNKGIMKHSDNQVKNAFYGYDIQCVLELLHQSIPKITKVSEKNLLPTYCYTRIYEKHAELEIHRDRESCEYSITLHLEGDQEWPIYIQNKKTYDFEKIILFPGDAVIYKGCEVYHYRSCYQGDEYIQCFLHYIDKDGPYKEWYSLEHKFHK